MVSDAAGARLAYAATFNGEQDVYYLRILAGAVFADGFESGDTSAWSSMMTPEPAACNRPLQRCSGSSRSPGSSGQVSSTHRAATTSPSDDRSNTRRSASPSKPKVSLPW